MSEAPGLQEVGGLATFATTSWTVVLEASGADSQKASDALAQLCQTYWYPLYAYIRRHGHGPDEAKDLTQEFFGRLIAKDFLSSVRRDRGKFRWFLMSALKRFLINEWNHEHAVKRGGQRTFVSLDEENGEGRYRLEPVDSSTPETLFNRAWALTMLEDARLMLQREYQESGRGPAFDQFKIFLSGDRAPISLAEAGAPLGMSEGAVKVAVHRLRGRYRECLREVIAATVVTPAEVDEEIRQLFAIFSQ